MLIDSIEVLLSRIAVLVVILFSLLFMWLWRILLLLVLVLLNDFVVNNWVMYYSRAFRITGYPRFSRSYSARGSYGLCGVNPGKIANLSRDWKKSGKYS